AEFKKALKADSKFRQAQFNLALVPLKKKDYAAARDRFEALLSKTSGGDKTEAAQLIKFNIYMTWLLEGKDSRAQKLMEQFQFTGDTPALYYAQAAWEFKHNNPTKATDWITLSKKIYSPALNVVFADSFYDLGWMQSPALATSPPPAAEAAKVPPAPVVTKAERAKEQPAQAAPAAKPPVVAEAKPTPATALAPARVGEVSRGKFESGNLFAAVLVLAGIGVIRWVVVFEIRRRGIHLPSFRRAAPVSGPQLAGMDLAPTAAKEMKVMPR